MFSKRTRLFVHFNLINFFHILKSLFVNKRDFQIYLKDFLKVENLSLTSLGRTALYDIVKIIFFLLLRREYNTLLMKAMNFI